MCFVFVARLAGSRVNVNDGKREKSGSAGNGC